MSDDKLLECCQAILDFLEEGNTAKIPTPKQLVMDDVFKDTMWISIQNNTDMIGFTKYLNDIFQLGYDIEIEGITPFFRNHSISFYKSIIRNLKIKQLLK